MPVASDRAELSPGVTGMASENAIRSLQILTTLSRLCPIQRVHFRGRDDSDTSKGSSRMKDLRRIFAEWPVSIPRQGIIVTSFGESIPFCNYMLCGELILLERKTPDAAGGRRVIMGLEGIQAIKILDAVELPRFTAMGFQGLLDGR